MKSIIAISFLISTNLFGQIIVPKDEYTFPKTEPLIAAISTSFIGTPNGTWLHVIIPLKRRDIKGMDDRVHFRYFKPKPKLDRKELIYILTGFGSTVKSDKANFLAQKLADDGFHSIVLPSIFSKRFIIGVSSEGVVGEFEKDAFDYLNLMKKTHQHIFQLYGVRFLKKHMIGYSYGGLTAAFVARIDQNKFFKLSREILINPPTDLLKAAEVVDQFTARKHDIGLWQFTKALAKAGYLKYRFQRYEPSIPIYKNYVRKLNFSPYQSEAMVGYALTESLPKVAESVQKVLLHDRGDLSGTAVMSGREIRDLTLNQYIRNIVLPFRIHNYDPSDTITKLGRRNSLYSLDSYFRTNNNVYLVHNKDDFLINKNDIKYFSKTFQDRFILFPWGGHLGNFWHYQNLNVVLAILKGNSLKDAITSERF